MKTLLFAFLVTLSPLAWSADAPAPKKDEKPPQVAGMFDLANAPSVVFLCDSSGSMMTKFDTLRKQIWGAVEALKPDQTFGLFFFSEDGFLGFDRKLVEPTAANKRKVLDFLGKTAPHGSSNPIPGIKAAFAAKPAMIYIVTDGDFPNNNEVLETLRKLNADKKVKVNTIAFIDRDESYEKFLKQLADENGGQFKYVGDRDVEGK
jgi:uncharacterized protein with von Willebrand factor type A (vWA) domain